jgi:hypothetical protein
LNSRSTDARIVAASTKKRENTMKATTKITAQLSKIDNTVKDITHLFASSNGNIEKILVSEPKWLELFGSYNAEARKMTTNVRHVHGIPVEFGQVNEAEIVLSVECEPF